MVGFDCFWMMDKMVKECFDKIATFSLFSFTFLLPDESYRVDTFLYNSFFCICKKENLLI
jgi:hypothetical protein